MLKKTLVIMELLLIVMIILLLLLYVYSVYNAVNNINTGASISYGAAIAFRTIGFTIILLLLLLLKKILKSYQLLYDVKVFTSIIKVFISNNKFLSFMTLIFLLTATLLSSVYMFQRSIIYFPNYYPMLEHKLIKNNEYEQITITSNIDNSIEYLGWSRYSEDRIKTIIYFGGNAESSALVFKSLEDNKWKSLKDYNFIMIDYPGYGKSSGSPSESDNYAMAESTYNYVREELDVMSNDIIIMGYSLGTGIASYVAANKNIEKLILIAPYSSMTDVFNTNIPIFYGPLRLLIKEKYDSATKGLTINVPTLIIASKGDKIIKYRLSKKLQETITNSKIVTFNKIKHNQFFSNDEVMAKLKTFIQS